MRRPFEGDPSAPAGNPLTPYAPPSYQMPAAGAYTAPAAPPPARTVPTLPGLVSALKRRWVLACFLGLLAGLAAAAGLWLGMPTGKHQVKGLLEILPLTNPINGQATGQDENQENFKKNQDVLIKTRSLVRAVADSPKVAPLPMVANAEDPVKFITDQINTKWEAPDVMAAVMNGDQPEQLRVILNEVMQQFVKQSTGQAARMREKRKEMLEAVKVKLNQKIDSYERMVKSVTQDGTPAGDNGQAAVLTQLTTQQNQATQEMGEYRKRINELDEQLRVIKADLGAADTRKMSEGLIDAELNKDETAARLNLEIAAEEKALTTAMATFVNQDNPTIVARKDSLAKLRAQLVGLKKSKRDEIEKRLRVENRTRLEDALERATKERDIKQGLLAKTQEFFNALDEKVRDIASKGSVLSMKMEELKPLKEQYLNISNQILEIEIAAKAEGRIQIREDAQIFPNHNIKQKMVFSAAVALGSFVCVLALVAYLEWRSRRVDSVDQVVNELNLRIIGTIPAFPSRASLKAGEADQNQNWRFILNESVNSTRTMLLHTAKSQSMQVIMVTSAMQGEGKTSLSSQLATSMATAGLRTLVLDFDLRNPSMHRLFDVQLTPGASEVLLQEVDVSDAVQPTSVPNLWMIPAGQCSNRVVAALAQGHPLETLFNRLRGQFDFIVVDSCPVLPVADALLIGQHVDGVVLSILQDISQLPKVMNASDRLTQLNIHLLGAVVNGIKTDVHAYGYNYVKQLPA